MNAVKIPQTDCIAVSPGCFDLPQVQCIEICQACDKGLVDETYKCAKCDGLGYVGVRLITRWEFTDEEWKYMTDHPESRGVYLHVCAAQTPPVLIDINEPFSTWDDIMPIKEYLKQNPVIPA